MQKRSSIFWRYLRGNIYLDILCLIGLLAYQSSKSEQKFSDFTFLTGIKLLGNDKRLGQRLRESLVKNNKYLEGIFDMTILGGILLV